MTSAGSPFGNMNSPDRRPPGPGGPLGPLGPGGVPLRPPGLMSLPPLEPLLPQALKDFKPNMPNMPPPNFDNGPPGFPRPQFQTPSRMHDQEVIRINDDSEDGQLRNHSLPEQFRRPSSRPGSRPSSPPPRSSQDAPDRDQQQHGPGGLGENG